MTAAAYCSARTTNAKRPNRVPISGARGIAKPFPSMSWYGPSCCPCAKAIAEDGCGYRDSTPRFAHSPRPSRRSGLEFRHGPRARLGQTNRARTDSNAPRGTRTVHSNVTALSPRTIHQPTEHPVQTLLARAEHPAFSCNLTRTDQSGSVGRAESS